MSLLYMNEMYKEVNISSIRKGGIKKTRSKKENKGTIFSIHLIFFNGIKTRKGKCCIYY